MNRTRPSARKGGVEERIIHLLVAEKTEKIPSHFGVKKLLITSTPSTKNICLFQLHNLCTYKVMYDFIVVFSLDDKPTPKTLAFLYPMHLLSCGANYSIIHFTNLWSWVSWLVCVLCGSLP
jgi:hypothetical protein